VGCVVYSEHNQYKGKKCSVEAAALALEKFSFAKLVEEEQASGTYYRVLVHDRCWFELEHKCEEPPAADDRAALLFSGYRAMRTKSGREIHLGSVGCSQSFCGCWPVYAVGEDLSTVTCKKCKEHNPGVFDEGYNCSWCDTDNLAGATHCAHCEATRGSHPNDRTYDF